MATGLSVRERIFITAEPSPGVILNSAGVPTLTAADFMRHTSCSIEVAAGKITDRDKDPSGDRTQATPGPRSGNFSITWEVRPRGASPWRPDWAIVAESALEAAGTSPSSGVYEFTSSTAATPRTFSIWRFRGNGTDLVRDVAFGCIVSQLEMKYEVGQNVSMTASGPCLWARDSANWATDAGAGLGGLTSSSFPTEPTGYAGNGLPVNSLAGVCTINSVSTFQTKSATVRITPGWEIPNDRLFLGAYGSAPERDVRLISADLELIEEGTADYVALKQAARAQTKIPIVLEAGTLTNNRFKVDMPNCVIPEPATNDSGRKWAANMSGIEVYAPTPIKLTIY